MSEASEDCGTVLSSLRVMSQASYGWRSSRLSSRPDKPAQNHHPQESASDVPPTLKLIEARQIRPCRKPAPLAAARAHEPILRHGILLTGGLQGAPLRPLSVKPVQVL